MIKARFEIKTKFGNYRTTSVMQFQDNRHLNNYMRKINNSGAKIIGFFPECFVRVKVGDLTLYVGSDGRVNYIDGATMLRTLNKFEVTSVRFFNTQELKHWWGKYKDSPMPAEISIRDIGWWDKDYTYHAPNIKVRRIKWRFTQ